MSEEEQLRLKHETDTIYKKLELYFEQKMHSQFVQRVHKNKIKAELNKESSDEDENGNLKPHKKPFS